MSNLLFLPSYWSINKYYYNLHFPKLLNFCFWFTCLFFSLLFFSQISYSLFYFFNTSIFILYSVLISVICFHEFHSSAVSFVYSLSIKVPCFNMYFLSVVFVVNSYSMELYVSFFWDLELRVQSSKMICICFLQTYECTSVWNHIKIYTWLRGLWLQNNLNSGHIYMWGLAHNYISGEMVLFFSPLRAKPRQTSLFFVFFFKCNPFLYFYFLFKKLFWPHCMSCGILVSWPGIEPMSPAVEAQSLNHWTTREVSTTLFMAHFFF